MFLHMGIQLFLHCLLENLSFLHLLISTSLLKICCQYVVGSSFLLLYGIPGHENTWQFIYSLGLFIVWGYFDKCYEHLSTYLLPQMPLPESYMKHLYFHPTI